MEQLLLIQEPAEEKALRKVTDLDERYKKLCKSLHAKSSTQQKKIDELERKLNFLESRICKENLFC